MRTFPLIAALALALTACQPAQPNPAQPAWDAAAIAGLEAEMVNMSVQMAVLASRVQALDENTSARLEALLVAATDLNARAQQPLGIGDVDLASIEGLVVTSTPEVIDFLTIAPGECDPDLPNGRSSTYAGELLVSAYWPAPTGPHCISYAGSDEHAAFGWLVNVPAGTVGTIALLPLE